MWSIMVRPEEDEQPGKTGELDVAIAFDLHRHLLLYPALDLMPVFPFEYKQAAAELSKSLARLGLSGLGLSLYCLRHGGASVYRNVNARPLAEVMQRGNWVNWASVLRYDKHGLRNHSYDVKAFVRQHRGRIAVASVLEMMHSRTESADRRSSSLACSHTNQT